jgi:hypothetical protein
MSKTKFTPGPWEAQGLYIMFTNADTKQFDWVAKVERFADKYKHEEAANAALIAAAPELYYALSGCADMLTEAAKQFRQRGDTGHATLCLMHAGKANAALSKARGEKPDEQ